MIALKLVVRGLYVLSLLSLPLLKIYYLYFFLFPPPAISSQSHWTNDLAFYFTKKSQVCAKSLRLERTRCLPGLEYGGKSKSRVWLWLRSKSRGLIDPIVNEACGPLAASLTCLVGAGTCICYWTYIYWAFIVNQVLLWCRKHNSEQELRRFLILVGKSKAIHKWINFLYMSTIYQKSGYNIMKVNKGNFISAVVSKGNEEGDVLASVG